MLPPIKISGDTARFAYKHAKGDRSAIRISRIVSETVRLGLKDVRWLVMGDDDTVFVAENLVGVLAKYDHAALMQQSICYDHKRHWTISVSWGYAVQIIRGTVSPREMEMPVRTFVNWHKKADYRGYAFNTRPVPRDHCRVPFVYTLTDAVYEPKTGKTASEYVRHRMDAPATKCNWKKFSDPEKIDRVEVYKTPDPDLWAKAPRRNCCRVLPSSNKKKKTVMIDVGECRENEVMEMR
ncbi:hypothetical protein LINGRAPRIM_LOCUS1860 [Linum grandiflorum]